MGLQMNCSRMVVNARKTIDSFSFWAPDKHNTRGLSHNNAMHSLIKLAPKCLVQSCQWRRLPTSNFFFHWYLLRIDDCFYYCEYFDEFACGQYRYCQRITHKNFAKLWIIWWNCRNINSNTKTTRFWSEQTKDEKLNRNETTKMKI